MLATSRGGVPAAKKPRKPNLVFVFPDQWRAQATGYAGDPNLQGKTPNLDKLAAESVDFTTAVSCCPVCTPYRASLLTGQYPLTTGIFLNDLCLSDKATSIAEAYKSAGYDTAYVGKWHLDGHGRAGYIPPERRQGFDYWKVLECTHDYNHSPYYADDDPTKRVWDGYDVIAQTRDAEGYIRDHAGNEKPFCLFLSWGPPHNPYETAPSKYRDMFDPKSIKLRPNVGCFGTGVSRNNSGDPQQDLAGYYAHIAAMDDCMGSLMKTLDDAGISDDTILVFTSDHGDMLGSQGTVRKQRPWDESILVPFLIRYPRTARARKIAMPINTPDIMPTLLALSGVPIPKTVEGRDHSDVVKGGKAPEDKAALIMCASPFGEYLRPEGREYRGVRTRRYTYVRGLSGPWLLYDNERDPYQLDNLIGSMLGRDFKSRPNIGLQAHLESLLQQELRQTNDEFIPGPKLIEKWGYKVDKNGTMPTAG
jgi:arylsulfatase A-like enzyme